MRQVIANYLPTRTPLVNSALRLPLVVALGFLSWSLIEKPALSIKDWPRRWCQRTFAAATA